MFVKFSIPHFITPDTRFYYIGRPSPTVTLPIFFKTSSYGPSAGSSDLYFGYNSISCSGMIGQSTVSAIGFKGIFKKG